MIAAAFAERTAEWIARLESAGVPCGPRAAARERRTRIRRSSPSGSSAASTQPGLGEVDLLAPFVRVGGERAVAAAAPALGADTDAVLAELA